MRDLIFIVFLIATTMTACKTKSNSGDYPKNKDGAITWIDISTAGTIPNTEQKPYLIDVYTDWCGWCKVMDNKTFTDPKVSRYISENFHAVKFNAEGRSDINFGGRNYTWVAQGRNGVNELAIELLDGQLSYPSFVFLDTNRSKMGIVKGYQTPEQFLPSMQQFITK